MLLQAFPRLIEYLRGVSLTIAFIFWLAEGAVFYSNVGDPEAWSDDRGTNLTSAAAQSKFEEFLRSYYRDSQGQQDYG